MIKKIGLLQLLSLAPLPLVLPYSFLLIHLQLIYNKHLIKFDEKIDTHFTIDLKKYNYR